MGLGEYSQSSSKPSDGARHWRHSHAADGGTWRKLTEFFHPSPLTARRWRHSHSARDTARARHGRSAGEGTRRTFKGESQGQKSCTLNFCADG